MYNIIPLDVKNKFHKVFTYSLLCDKYKSSNILINKSNLPTYEQHLQTLETFPFHCFYLISFNKIVYGEMFVDKNMKFGIYTKKSRLRRIIKKFKTCSFIKNRSTTISKVPFEMMVKAHPEIKKLYAEINSNNLISSYGAEVLGFQKKYIIMEYNNE